ncbi:purine-binding chemotaxis protein CheW [Anaerotaenia torta]|uniref:chemotaxis protein CheW n=1 Tax=Anaerotaenia torta TaxID=433293 RepID=UPI003D2632EF
MATDMKQFIIAYLDKDQYGIDINYIDNIIVMQSITRIPKAQSWFQGVINLRGEIVPVMSLCKRLGKEETPCTSSSRIIIVRPDSQAAPVGIIVDSVKEVITLEPGAIEKINYEEQDEKANYSIGIGKYGAELVNLLNIPNIVIEKDGNARKE